MVGYVESLTDPSYHKQILVFTYPMIGNYGVPNDENLYNPFGLDPFGLPLHFESSKIWPIGIVVSELSSHYSHWNASQSLEQYLYKNKVSGIHQIDTRELTKYLRDKGSALAKIVYSVPQISSFLFFDPNTTNLVDEVSTKQAIVYNELGFPKIVAFDCGVKYNQIRCLVKSSAMGQVIQVTVPILCKLFENT